MAVSHIQPGYRRGNSMYSFRYKFYPKTADAEEYEQLIWSLTGTLLRNGQLIDRDMNVACAGNTFEYAGLCPGADSLDPKYHDKFVEDAYKRLLESSVREPEWSIVGEVVESGKPCACDPATFLRIDHQLDVEPSSRGLRRLRRLCSTVSATEYTAPKRAQHTELAERIHRLRYPVYDIWSGRDVRPPPDA